MALLLSEAEVRTLLEAPSATVEAVDVMETVFVEQAHRRLALRPRINVDYPPGSVGETSGRSLRMLPCVVPALDAAAVRVYTTNKVGDARRPAPAELILLFSYESMELRAIIEDYSLHNLRTAAPTGVATRYLARRDATRVGVLGSGRHARAQLAAVASVRAIDHVEVYSPRAESRETFAREAAELLGIPVLARPDAETVVRQAEILVVATTTPEPVLREGWIAPGTHINSMAPSELDRETVLRARTFPNLADDLVDGQPPWPPIPELLAEELLDPGTITELCEVVAGTAAGRTETDDVTLFISTGMASWDVAIGVWAEAAARRAGLGSELWNGGGRSLVGSRQPLPTLSV